MGGMVVVVWAGVGDDDEICVVGAGFKPTPCAVSNPPLCGFKPACK